jgi:hypothetical protein
LVRPSPTFTDPPAFPHRFFPAISHDDAVMPKWLKWSVFLACVLLIGVLAATLTRETEPSYQGRSLSKWLSADDQADAGTAPAKEAAAAIRQIGTNALPYLLECVRYETPKTGIRPAVANLLRLMPRALRSRALTSWALDERGASRARSGIMAFAILREDQARPAIPELARLLSDPRSTNISRSIIVALAFAGEDAIPALSAYLATTNAVYRLDLVHACGAAAMFRTNMVPPLVEWLGHADPEARAAVAFQLGFLVPFTTQPQMVINALIDCLRANSDPSVRVAAIDAIAKYAEDARAAVPSLLEMVGQPDRQVREAATNALMEIAPEALTNSPPAPGQLTVPTPGTGFDE